MGTPLHSIPESEFPLNWERFCELHDMLDEAIDGFGHFGHPDLAAACIEVRRVLWAARNLIQAKEQEERLAAEKDTGLPIQVLPKPDMSHLDGEA